MILNQEAAPTCWNYGESARWKRLLHKSHGTLPKRVVGVGLSAALVLRAFAGLSDMTNAHEFCAEERNRMVNEVAALARVVPDTRHAKLDPRVLEAMRRVPRHEFVPAGQRHAAYRNRPLPIGQGQTISQPYIVALMTDLLQLAPAAKVLEIGTGCGYQAAVLAEIAADVYSIEIVEPLARTAADTLARLGYRVSTRIGDGYRGWPEAAPFDAIIVTAAPDHIPPALVAQLKPGGRMVIPVGALNQELMVVTKNADGTTINEDIVAVRFVPLTRNKD